LWREGMILGKVDGEPSLGRTDEAVALFQRALDIADDHATQDPNDSLSRRNVAKVGLELGAVLRYRDPAGALAVYDRALRRVREIKSSAATQLAEAALLASSSYAVRALHREDEAKQRIELALRLLRELKQYPAEKIEPLSEPDRAVRALADHYAEVGQLQRAIDTYQELLAKITAWKLDPQNDLRDATCLSRTWLALATVLKRAGRADEAAALDARRTELAIHWSQKLPGNTIVHRQVSGTS
jgi:tetratricopeptide (TPR) repeat protein